MIRFWVLREINSRFCSKTQWQMFLLISGRHVGAHLGGHQHGVSIQIFINLRKTFLRISCIRKIAVTWILAGVFAYLPSLYFQILDLIYGTVLIAYFDLFWMAWHWKPAILRILQILRNSVKFFWTPLTLSQEIVLTSTQCPYKAASQNILKQLRMSFRTRASSPFLWENLYHCLCSPSLKRFAIKITVISCYTELKAKIAKLSSRSKDDW